MKFDKAICSSYVTLRQLCNIKKNRNDKKWFEMTKMTRKDSLAFCKQVIQALKGKIIWNNFIDLISLRKVPVC